MINSLLSIREVVEPIIGGYWGETVEVGAGNARVVRNGDILDSGEISTKVPERKLNDKEITKSRLHIGDILITMSGNVGRVARVRSEYDCEGKPYVASNFVKILRAKKNTLPEYLFFFLRSSQLQNELMKYTRGVAMQNLSVKAFDQKLVPAVTKKEQKRIVDILKEAEELKLKRTEADHKMTTVIPALFNKMFGDPMSWESKWETKPLGDMVEVVSGGTPATTNDAYWGTTGVPWVSAKDMKTDFISDSIDHITQEAMSQGHIRLIPKGSVLVVVRGMILAHTFPVSLNTVALTINQDLKALTPKEIDSVFLWGALQSARKQLLTRIKTAAHGTKKLDTGDLLQVRIPTPGVNMQKEFAERVNEILAFKVKQKRSTVNINELFASLLSQAFSAAK